MELACKNCAHPIPEQSIDWVYLVARCPKCDNWNAYPLALDHPQNINVPNRHSPIGLGSNQVQAAPSQSLGGAQIAVEQEEVDGDLSGAQSEEVPALQRDMVENLPPAVESMGINAEYYEFARRLFISRSENQLVIRYPSIGQPDLADVRKWPKITIDRKYLSAEANWLHLKSHRYNISGFRQFYVKRIARNGLRKYGLFGLNSEHKYERLLSGELRLLLVIESEIEKFFGIEDVPVSGAQANPFQFQNSVINAEEISDPRYERVALQPTSYLSHEHSSYVQTLRLHHGENAMMIFFPLSKENPPKLFAIVAVMTLPLLIMGSLGIADALVSGGASFFVNSLVLFLGLASGRWVLDVALNSDAVMIDKDYLYISARPYPKLRWLRRRIKISQHVQFYGARINGLKREGFNFGLFGIDVRGNRHQIVTGEEKFVLFLESEIEKFLNVEDSPVGGSLSNPYQVQDI